MTEVERKNWGVFRERRNHKLQRSDRYMLWDSSISDAKKQEWAVYRTALRDLPASVSDPANVSWPNPPA